MSSHIKVPTLIASGVLAVAFSLTTLFGGVASANPGFCNPQFQWCGDQRGDVGVGINVLWQNGGGHQWPGGNGHQWPGNGCEWNRCGNGMPWGWSRVAVASAWAGQGTLYHGSRGPTWFECPPGMPFGAHLAEWQGTVYWVV